MESSLPLGWQRDVEADSAPSLLGLIAAVPGCLSWVVAVTMVSQKSYVVKLLAGKVRPSNTRQSIFGVGVVGVYAFQEYVEEPRTP